MEEEIRRQLEQRLEEKYQPILERRRAEYALTNEEWVKQSSQRSGDGAEKHLESFGSEAGSRSRINPDELFRVLIQQKTEELLPILLKMQLEGGLTEEAFEKASMIASNSQIASIQEKLQATVGKQTNPRMKAIFEKLSQNVAEDRKDLDRLMEPDISQETLDGVTANITRRKHELTNLFKDGDKQEPE